MRNIDFKNLPKVGFIGLSRSGKGLASDLLVSKLNFVSYTLSDTIREYAKENKILLKSRDDFRRLGDELEERFGEDYLIKKALQKLEEQFLANRNIKGLVFDGMRRMNVVQQFKDLPNSLLIYVEASPEARFQRERAYRPEDSVQNLKEFEENEAKDAEIIKQMSSLVDLTIINEGSLEEFQTQVINIVRNTFLEQVRT